MTPLNDLEREAMNYLLRGDHPVLAVLREQLESASVVERRLTGVGFFTDFEVSSRTPRLADVGRFIVGDVHAEVSGLAHGAGFLLFVEQGALGTLECFIVEDSWPTDAKLLRLYYMHPEKPGSGALVEVPERDLDWAVRSG